MSSAPDGTAPTSAPPPSPTTLGEHSRPTDRAESPAAQDLRPPGVTPGGRRSCAAGLSALSAGRECSPTVVGDGGGALVGAVRRGPTTFRGSRIFGCRLGGFHAVAPVPFIPNVRCAGRGGGPGDGYRAGHGGWFTAGGGLGVGERRCRATTVGCGGGAERDRGVPANRRVHHRVAVRDR